MSVVRLIEDRGSVPVPCDLGHYRKFPHIDCPSALNDNFALIESCLLGVFMNPSRMTTKRGRNSRSQGANAGLSKGLESRLAAYAKAAGAAGVGLFAVAPPANAKVVYTPAHIVFDGGAVPIDLNHDGVNDFTLSIYNFLSSRSGGDGRRMRVVGAAGNGALCSGSSGYPPLALKAGYRIGANERYGSFDRRGAPAVNVIDLKSEMYVGGPFANAGDRFLGLKFSVSGETHYGWALIRVGAALIGQHATIRATLLGYAYDTVAGQAIGAGQGASEGARAAAMPEASTLGMLALGWSAAGEPKAGATTDPGF